AEEPIGVAVRLFVPVPLLLRLGLPVAVPLPISIQVSLLVLVALAKRQLPEPVPSAAEKEVRQCCLIIVLMVYLRLEVHWTSDEIRVLNLIVDLDKCLFVPGSLVSLMFVIDDLSSRDVGLQLADLYYIYLSSFVHYDQFLGKKVHDAILVNLPRGYGYVEFKKRGDAEKALLYMDGVC
ncbi:hypothetical protein BHM03_00009532, partial [Ensete ventricosum]